MVPTSCIHILCDALTLNAGWTCGLVSSKYNTAEVKDVTLESRFLKDCGFCLGCSASFSLRSLTLEEASCHIMRQPQGEIHKVRDQGLATTT